MHDQHVGPHHRTAALPEGQSAKTAHKHEGTGAHLPEVTCALCRRCPRWDGPSGRRCILDVNRGMYRIQEIDIRHLSWRRGYYLGLRLLEQRVVQPGEDMTSPTALLPSWQYLYQSFSTRGRRVTARSKRLRPCRMLRLLGSTLE